MVLLSMFRCSRNSGGRGGPSPLLAACATGDIETARALLAKGDQDPLEVRDKRGRLAIHLAARFGGEQLVRLLLQGMPASPEQQQQHHQQRAAEHSHGNSISGDHDARAAVARAATADASTGCSTDKSVLERGEDRLAYARAMACAVDNCGLTPLHYAAAADDATSCRLLLGCGASLLAASTAPCYDSQMPCNAGSTALHVTAMNNALKAADVIIMEWVRLSTPQRLAQWCPSAGPAANSRAGMSDIRAILDKEGKTACMVAATRRFEALVGLLDLALPLPLPEEALAVRPPPMYCCPITLDLMQEPAVICDGFTYERAAIEKWLLVHGTSPMTNAPLPQKAVFPNHILRQAISVWRLQHGLGELPRAPGLPALPPPAPADAGTPVNAGGAVGAGGLGLGGGRGGAVAAASPPATARRGLPVLQQTDGFLRELGPRRRGALSTALRV